MLMAAEGPIKRFRLPAPLLPDGPVERKHFYTPEVCAQIKQWVADGLDRTEIAHKLGTTVNRLAVNCSYRHISLTNQQRVQSEITLDLQTTTHFGLVAEANRRGWTVEHLIEQLCEIIQRDNLFNAVLDP